MGSIRASASVLAVAVFSLSSIAWAQSQTNAGTTTVLPFKYLSRVKSSERSAISAYFNALDPAPARQPFGGIGIYDPQTQKFEDTNGNWVANPTVPNSTMWSSIPVTTLKQIGNSQKCVYHISGPCLVYVPSPDGQGTGSLYGVETQRLANGKVRFLADSFDYSSLPKTKRGHPNPLSYLTKVNGSSNAVIYSKAQPTKTDYLAASAYSDKVSVSPPQSTKPHGFAVCTYSYHKNSGGGAYGMPDSSGSLYYDHRHNMFSRRVGSEEFVIYANATTGTINVYDPRNHKHTPLKAQSDEIYSMASVSGPRKDYSLDDGNIKLSVFCHNKVVDAYPSHQEVHDRYYKRDRANR